MRICTYAKPVGRPCDDGWSLTIICQRDGVLRCLKECIRGCEHYSAKSGVPPTKPKYSAWGASSSKAGVPCGAPCGGTRK